MQQASLAVAYVANASGAEGVARGTIGPRHCDIDALLRQLHAKSTHLALIYAAGPCGYWRSRELAKTGAVCWVAAPALMPKKAGARVNTDRRAAVHLARLMRSGTLTPVSVPRRAEAATRDRTRAREDARRDRQTAKFRRNALRLRQARRSTGQAHWRPAHRRWLAEVVCPTPAQPSVFPAYVRAVTAHPERLRRLEQALHEQIPTWRLAPVVEAIQALRGVPCTVAVTLVAARGDLTRFATPRQLMNDLGLTPSEYSSGARRRQDGIPNTGHMHARRALVEGAWADRDPATVSRHLQRCPENLLQGLQDLRWQAQVRVWKR